jgi:hypothetical protein
MSAIPAKEQSSAPATPRAESLPELTNERVKVPEPADVLGYLASHRDMTPLLPLICARVRMEFGSQAELLLRVYRDPEIHDEYLALYVRQRPYDAQLMERLDSICEQFEKELSESSGWLLLTSDFREPDSVIGSI